MKTAIRQDLRRIEFGRGGIMTNAVLDWVRLGTETDVGMYDDSRQFPVIRCRVSQS